MPRRCASPDRHSPRLCALAALGWVLSSCSPPPDQHVDALLAKLEKLHTSLVAYKRDPSGVTEVSGFGIKGQRSLGVEVAINTKYFFDSVGLASYPVFRDIQEMQGYEAWATEATRRLKEKADGCLTVVRAIKTEHKRCLSDPLYHGTLVRNNVPNRQYPALWLSKEVEIVFALDAGQGVDPRAL